MKSNRDSSFFSPSPEAKKQRTHPIEVASSAITSEAENMLGIPNEIWVEILKNLDKKQLRDASPTNSFFYQLITKQNLFQKAPWPVTDYAKLIAPKCSRKKFKWLSHDDVSGQYTLAALKNGSVVAGTEAGHVLVLELGSSEWRLYGQHRRTASSRGLRSARVNYIQLLPCGLLATCGHDGARLWNTKTRSEVQFLCVPESLWPAQLNGIHELPNGDLITSSIFNQFYLWRKTGLSEAPYQFAEKLFDAKGDDVSQLFLWSARNDKIVSCGSTFVSRWLLNNGLHTERIEISKLKHRLAQKMKALRRDDVFITTHLEPAIVNFFNDVIDHADDAIFDFEWSTPDCLLEQGYIIAAISYFKFLFKPFDESVSPIYLGCTTEMLHEITLTDDLFIGRNTLLGMEILSGFDTKANTFKYTHTFELGYVSTFSLLDNGHAIIFPQYDSPYIFDIYTSTKLHNLNLELPQNIPINEIQFTRLKNGNLLCKYYSPKHKLNKYIIWEPESDKVCSSFFARDDEKILENGDILTHSYNRNTGDDVSVVRFGVK